MYSAYADDFGENAGGLELKIVGILEPKEDIAYGCLESGVYYTQAFAEQVIAQNKDSEIVDYIRTVSADEDSNVSNVEEDTIYSGYYEYNYGETTVDVSIGIGYEYVFDGKRESAFDFVGSNSQYELLLSMVGGSSGSSMNDYKSFTVRQLGGEEVANNLYFYPIDFDSKDLVTDWLDEWNAEGALTYYSLSQQRNVTLTEDERDQVTYTDSLELIITMINTMIDIITYGLVAFTSISLVVSSVMIGVITYVSVVERTKEIGVLRSLGARKRDVSNLFNAETFIIGLLAGVFGVGITYLLSVPLNLILGSLTGISTLVALPWWQAIIMICISFALTVISGLFPARAAAKKDPVIALRTE